MLAKVLPGLTDFCNYSRYTMRLCDFMVDHLGDWDLIVCNGNSVDSVFRYGKDASFCTGLCPDAQVSVLCPVKENNAAFQDNTMSVTGREQQLIFRHRPGRQQYAVFFMPSVIDLRQFRRS